MEPKLSVVIRIELDAHRVRIVVTGRLTGLNQQALHLLIDRARTLTPGARVVIDLSSAVIAEPAGLELLREAVNHAPLAGPIGTVDFLLPIPDLERSMTGEAHPLGAEQPTQSALTRRVAA